MSVELNPHAATRVSAHAKPPRRELWADKMVVYRRGAKEFHRVSIETVKGRRRVRTAPI